jgi:hypothetical protein
LDPGLKKARVFLSNSTLADISSRVSALPLLKYFNVFCEAVLETREYLPRQSEFEKPQALNAHKKRVFS